ncbi:LTA synthase family protein [Vibrio sinaloensis]|uniref:LTA synthase family protein n=1 Tax=Photobacterium sp. (strain ATCC 43367) TaxID=379097 RepID=UPI00058089B4|nr:alkaline phosphatase family protein [Vibrio sinaloensis]KHT52337.1 phosphoglycerol transferase [Vibrio sinaloensis]
MVSFQHNYRALIRIVLWVNFAAIIFLSLSRGVFFSLAVEPEKLSGLSADIVRAFWVGARFDAKIVFIGFAPVLLAGLILAKTRFFAWWNKATPWYAGVIFFLLCGFSIGNYYYYVTYGSYIDVFVFGLFDDDTKAVLDNAWQDYPILRSFLVSVLVAALGFIFTNKLIERSYSWHWPKRHWVLTTVSVLLTIVVYVIVARGSIGSLPLKRYHANVSQYKPLNIITPNPFMALSWANGDYKKQAKFDPVSERALTEQMMKMLGQPTPEYRTNKNDYLADNPPHVVMALMEGLGTNVLIEDDPTRNDLLGSLRKAFDEDFVFERFVAGTTATIDSIVMMLFHSDVPTISHSGAQKVSLPSSAVLPYKRAGYEVVFIYGGNSMWRNLANYLPLQGFDTVYDENSIKAAFPEAKEHADTWGVADEFTFKFARKLLDEAKKPTLIYIMTVTNHSPYRPPSDYQPKVTHASERLKDVIGSIAGQETEMLEAYQYANDALGNFIQEVKDSDLGQKTLIAASGDHRVRSISTKNLDEFAVSYAVPFYLYVPDPILSHSQYRYQPERIGSHRDIFPTLYQFSLSDQSYISLGGENMLSVDGGSNRGYNKVRSINQWGAYENGNPTKLYAWDEGVMTQTTPTDNPESDWAQEYHKLQNYYLRSQVAGAN